MTRTNSVTSRVTARVDGSEGSDRTTNYLPSFRSALRPTLHAAHPADWSRSLCGAPVIGILVWDEPLECVVCAELREGRKINNLDNIKPRKRSLLDRIRRR